MNKNKLHPTVILYYLNIFTFLFLLSGCDKENETIDPIEENYLPSCLITSPNYADEIPQESIIKISVKAKDSLGYIKKVEIYIDSVKKATLPTRQNEYNWLWDTKEVSLGNHTIKVIAYDDNDEFSSAEQIVNVTLNKISDIEGNDYKIVKIGSQIWMAENLRSTKYNDGTPIQLIDDYRVWRDGITIPAYCWYRDNIDYKNTFGALYTGYTVMTNEICPTGWHVPTQHEWGTLKEFLGDNSGVKLKTPTMWEPSDLNNSVPGTNIYRFNALPSGWRTGDDGTFISYGTEAAYWSSTEVPREFYDAATRAKLVSYSNYLSFSDYSLTMGYSVRCVKD